MSAQVVRWHGPEGCRALIVTARGRKYLQAVVVDTPVKVLRLKLAEERNMTALDLPLKRALKSMRAAGRHLGITKGAKAALKGAQP